MRLPWSRTKRTTTIDLEEKARESEHDVVISAGEVRASARRLRTAADTLVDMNALALAHVPTDE